MTHDNSQLLLYDDLAEWWPLLSPPSHYVEEAADILPRLLLHGTAKSPTMLELGSGGGSLAFHLKRHFRMTLTDRSARMLAMSQAVNPDCEHLQGDMRALRLDRLFDFVLIHDAIMYATEPAAVQAALQTAAVHCRPGGTIAVLPDCVRETFTPETEHGGEDAPDGRGLRYMTWTWDPDPDDNTYLVDYAILLRERDGSVSVTQDRHVGGMFARAQWLEWFAQAGFTAHSVIDPWDRDVFIGTRSGG